MITLHGCLPVSASGAKRSELDGDFRPGA